MASGMSPLRGWGGPVRPPPPGSIWLGASVPIWPDHQRHLDTFSRQAGKSPALVMDYRDWRHHPEFDVELADRTRAQGATLMLTWEPWDYTAGVEQPAYALRQIINGAHDTHIRRWAQGISRWGHPMMLRFAHEMNGDWNSWSEGVNGNRSGEYVKAWDRVHRIFQREGADVAWVWSPNAGDGHSRPLAGFHPGEALVDWHGVDGYNWGDHHDQWKSWTSFPELFEPTITRLGAIARKPLLVAETASAEHGGSELPRGARKATWIHEMFDTLEQRLPQISGVVWFNHHKEEDWPIQSSPAAAAAFAARIADPRYVGGPA